MIVQQVLNFFSRLIAGFFDALPDLPPDVAHTIETLPDLATQAAGYVGTLSPVLPIQDINVAIRVVVAGIVIAFTLRILRMVASYASGGGGA